MFRTHLIIYHSPLSPFLTTKKQRSTTVAASRSASRTASWTTPHWYNGKAQQVVRLELLDHEPLRPTLEGIESRKSCRFTRSLGSRRMLQVRLSADRRRARGRPARVLHPEVRPVRTRIRCVRQQGVPDGDPRGLREECEGSRRR